MIRYRSVLFFGALFWAAHIAVGAVQEPVRAATADPAALRQAIFEAEESRAPDAASLKILVDALKHPEAGIRWTAVRALGRLVRPALVENIAPLLSDPDASTRAEAANSLAQSIVDVKPGGSEAAEAFFFLEARLKSEPDPATRGVIVRTIGRLAYPDETKYRKAEKILLAAAGGINAELDPARRPEVLGAAKGAESLLRRKAKAIQADDGLVARLKSMAVSKPPAGQIQAVNEDSARIRRLAMTALSWAGRLDERTLQPASADPDEQVRRLVFAGLGRMGPEQVPGDAVGRIMSRGLRDRSDMVRYEALRLYGRTKWDADPAPVLAALEDSSPHVALLSVDLLGQLKSVPGQIVTTLKELAGEPASAGSSAAGTAEGLVNISGRSPSKARLMAAHALVSLAKIAPDRARGILPDFMAAPEGVVRMYAAEAAVTLKDVQALERLIGDSHDNVRNAALSGLIALKGHAVDDRCLAALERDDYQLIFTALGGLKDSPSAVRAVPALFSALARLTAQKRETSRDPRQAILERLGELGSKEQAEAASAYTRDFDPLVAAAAADLVGRWTGRRPEVEPRAIPKTFARLSDVEKLRGATVRVTIAGSGAFEMTLFVDETPAAVARFVALVRSGYYNGLTVHRVIPNFLIQGGSPGANEYSGDGPFMRDESGLESNTRGTVGISTRGRDTGDAQFYVNTVDNDRLDHDYFVFARVASGMDVVDRVLEGDIIERMDLIRK